MKRIMQIALAVVVAVGFMGSANAAVNQKLVDYAKKSGASKETMVRIEKFLTNNEVTDEQAADIISYGNKIKAVFGDKEISYENAAKLSSADKNRVLGFVENAAKVVNAEVTFDGSSKSFVVTDAKGTQYDAPLKDVLAQTDGNNTLVVASVSGALIVGVAALAMSKRRENA